MRVHRSAFLVDADPCFFLGNTSPWQNGMCRGKRWRDSCGSAFFWKNIHALSTGKVHVTSHVKKTPKKRAPRDEKKRVRKKLKKKKSKEVQYIKRSGSKCRVLWTRTAVW